MEDGCYPRFLIPLHLYYSLIVNTMRIDKKYNIKLLELENLSKKDYLKKELIITNSF